MDAFTRAVPDFVITMSQSIRYAEKGFDLQYDKHPTILHPSLTALYSLRGNPTSTILKNFYHLLGDVATPATHAACDDPIHFILAKGSFKSARDRLRQAASQRRRATLYRIARPSLRPLLDEILIPDSSWPIVGMNRSRPQNRRQADLLLINMQMKLHLEIYNPDNLPKCLCGATIDAHSLHTFSCRRVSKKIMHDRINAASREPTETILISAGVLARGSKVTLECKKVLPEMPGLRPLDCSWRPSHLSNHANLAPSTLSMCGIDYTITPPVGHRPPSHSNAATTSNLPAPADKHLSEKERKKLMRDGACDQYTHTSWSGDEIIGEMLKARIGLLPYAISPHGRPGPMAQRWLYGGWSAPAYKFPTSRPNARLMYNTVMSPAAPIGIIPLATANWKRTKCKRQHFYGHTYTCPTPKEYYQQRMGLGIANAVAMHVRDVTLGHMIEPSDSNDEDFEHPLSIHADTTNPIAPDDDGLYVEDVNDLPFDIFAEPLLATTTPNPAAVGRLPLFARGAQHRVHTPPTSNIGPPPLYNPNLNTTWRHSMPISPASPPLPASFPPVSGTDPLPFPPPPPPVPDNTTLPRTRHIIPQNFSMSFLKVMVLIPPSRIGAHATISSSAAENLVSG